MANVGVGGLYATVNLDVTQALRQLNKLDAKMKKIFQSSGTKATTGMNQLSASTKKASSSMTKASSAANKTTASTKKLGKQAKQTSKETTQLSDSVKKMGSNLSTSFASLGAARSGNWFYAVSTGLKGMTRNLGAAGSGITLAGAALGGFIATAVLATATVAAFVVGLRKIKNVAQESAANLERLGVSFEALLGNAARARNEMNFLIEAAKVSPYFTEDIVALDRFLLAQGLLNDQLRQGVVKGLIDFGSAAGLTGEKLRDLGYALGQVYNAGRLTGDEARQLRNNFLGAEQVLRTLPRYAEKTGLELKKAMETGAISSADFFQAFFGFTGKFEDAAAKQQQTLKGLKDTFVDVFQLGLGTANIAVAEFNKAFSPLENSKAVLRELLAIFDQIDFGPLIASIGALVNSFIGPLTKFLHSTSGTIVNFFQVNLPKAVLVAANIVRAFSATVQLVGRTVGLIFQQVGVIFRVVMQILTGDANTAASAMTGIGRAILVMAAPAIVGLAAVAAGLSFIITLARATWQAVTFQWGDAMQTLSSGALDASHIFVGALASIGDAWDALGNLEAVTFNDLVPSPLPDNLADARERAAAGVTGGEAAFPPSGNADAAGAASAAAKAADKAMDSLFNLSQRWFGLRSELEKGLLGKDGFTATADSIASMGEKLVKALRSIEGASGAAALIEEETLSLLRLVDRRLELADQLKAAESALSDAIKSRDNFAKKVKDTALKFALAFKTEEQSMRSFQLVSERGFFYETEQKKQKSFVQSLQERLAKAKKFLADVKKLKESGLNASLLEEIVAAGPDAAGDVADALALGGQAMIDETNELTSAVTQVAEELSQFGAKEFYQAGVDIAQAQVNGLTNDLGAIEAAALEISDTIFATVADWAQELTDAGSAAGSGLATGLSSGFGDVAGFFDTINTEVGGATDWMSGEFANLPGVFGGALLDNESDLQTKVDEMFANLQANNLDWFSEYKDDFNLAGTEFGEAFINALKEEMSKWWDKVKPEWTDFINPFEFVLQTAMAGVQGIVSLAFKGIVGMFQALFKWVVENWEWSWLSTAFWFAWDSIVWIAAKGVNTVISWMEGLVNGAINALNFLIEAINFIPGVTVPLIPKVNFPEFGVDAPWDSTQRPSTTSDSWSRGDSGWGSTPSFDVTVFIGDREITDIVDTRVAQSSSTDARYLTGARRN